MAIIAIYAGERNLRVISDATWQAIIAANHPEPRLFRNGDRIVWVEFDDQERPVMRTVTEPRLKHHLVRIARFYKIKDGEEVDARPPKDLPTDLLARPDKSALPYLRAVVACPVFDASGQLTLSAGFNPQTGMYYSPRGLDDLPPVEVSPPAYEIDLARELIVDDLLGDFPFVGSAERAHAVAALLQPFLRPMILGPTPLYLIEKPTPGTGGTLLAHVLCCPALGCFPSAVTQPKTESEWRYALLSWLRDGPSVILIDNLGSRLESAALASALTDVTFRDRIIGTSDAVSVPAECMWVATGNNPALSSEIARRTVRIRLDAGTEHPDSDRTFRHHDLRAMVLELRSPLVWSALTVISAWIAEGRPAGDATLGGFENWSRTMGGVLKVVGIDGFLANRDLSRNLSDSDSAEITSFLGAWWGRFKDAKVGVSELFDLAGSLDLGDRGEQSRRVRLGRLLDSLRDRRFGNFTVQKTGPYQGAQRYQLQCSGDTADGSKHIDS